MALPVLPHTPATLSTLVAVAASRLDRPSADLAAAHWALETAGGKSCYGYNVGNLTCGAAPSAPCGTHPLVTNGLTFALFGDFGSGADAYLAFIDKHGGMSALEAADVNAYASALAAMGYAGSGVSAAIYAGWLNAWLPKAQAVVLPPSGIGGLVTFKNVAVVGAVAVVGLFVGSWAADGFNRPKIRQWELIA